MRVVICGAGVIGAAIAHFLSLRQVETVVVERRGVACAASGKSGGFLALDWCDGTPLEPLARRSFALHGELATTLGGDVGHRRLDTLAVLAGAPGWWSRIEPLDTGLGFRMPYSRSEDYWLYQQRVSQAVSEQQVVVVGDSVIWGEYVEADDRLYLALVDGCPAEASGVAATA